jgi:putative ABC transport system substrate-binding protein
VKRRHFISLIGGATAWPLVARAQPAPFPVVGVVNGGSAEAYTRETVALRRSLSDSGYVEGQNVAVEYHWLEGQYERLPALMSDLVHREVAVIATTGSGPAALAAKTATKTIPIVFGLGEDPVQLGLVANLARPGGNATGINFFFNEVIAKRLRLLHDLVPKAVRVGVLINPRNGLSTDATSKVVQTSAPSMGLQTEIFKAATVREIDAAFAAIAHEHMDALFVAPDAFFTSRAVQFATLAASDKIPASYGVREFVMVGGLMSYGTDLAEVNYQVGRYVGSILKGAKPSDLPVLQSTKFEFVLNLQTARALGIEVPSGVLSIADEVVE